MAIELLIGFALLAGVIFLAYKFGDLYLCLKKYSLINYFVLNTSSSSILF